MILFPNFLSGNNTKKCICLVIFNGLELETNIHAYSVPIAVHLYEVLLLNNQSLHNCIISQLRLTLTGIKILSSSENRNMLFFILKARKA